MKLYPTEQFVKCYEDLSQNVQKQTDKQLELLLTNFRPPSLRTKKIRGTDNIWEARVTREYRFTFQIEGELYILRKVGTHRILKSP
jgi:mRNA-degrading endonuclease RelE of RelBE toxin-antitoxin system